MQVRIPVTFVFGALAMAAVASAQTPTTTSSTRIPISKEGGTLGPRIDTVTVYHTDTLTQYRVDTVTVTRVDTMAAAAAPAPVTVAAMPRMLRQIGGFYIGVDGGAAVPTGDELRTAQSTGWHVDVPFGVDPIGSPLGLRLNVGYSHFDTRDIYAGYAGNPQILSGNADLKLRLPMTSSFAHRFQIYAVGGASYNRFQNLIQYDQTTGAINIGGYPYTAGTVYDDSWHSAWGWNAGGGLQFGWGRTNLFVESRYEHFDKYGALNQIPVVVGLNWY